MDDETSNEIVEYHKRIGNDISADLLTNDDPELHPITDMLLSWIEGYWLAHGVIPSVDVAVSAGVREDLYVKWMRSRLFRRKLAGRGVRISVEQDGDTENFVERFSGGLTELQMATINILTDLDDTRSYKMKLSDLGVSTQLYQSWLRDPVFQRQLKNQVQLQFEATAFEIDLALIDKVKSGDMQAIKYADEKLGRYVSVKDRANNVDVVSILMQLSEIIEQEIPDADTRRRIATRLSPLIAAAYGESQMNSRAGAR